MTEDPHGRPGWDPNRESRWDTASSWSAPPGQGASGYGPATPPYPPGGPAHPPWPEHPPSADGGPQTLHHPPGTAPPGTALPSGDFAWREGGDAPPPPPRRSLGLILGVIGAVVALAAVAVAAYLLAPRFLRGSTPTTPTAVAPAPAPPAPVPAPATAPAPSGPLTLTASADCVSPPSRDAAGATVDYGPARMVDGRADSAWRCDGDGAGQTIRITFDRPARVQEVGIVAGYDKIDPTDGTDRFAQNRRIAAVRYTFDDNTTVEQSLRTGTGDRSLQTVAVPGVTSSGVTITIVRSVPGNAVGGAPASDRVAISELRVSEG